ncbi:hypothetical protein CEXT_327911 [Caerostris extrusa]|uniref:Uncharacterized protein n=1 Tax=Caerostris extrusa TaxID=172846 RepID=A0AAV4VBW7_CAEEX|nr:hypothetical protein CEXT_327911 [Caerostris extrusa]
MEVKHLPDERSGLLGYNAKARLVPSIIGPAIIVGPLRATNSKVTHPTQCRDQDSHFWPSFKCLVKSIGCGPLSQFKSGNIT